MGGSGDLCSFGALFMLAAAGFGDCFFDQPSDSRNIDFTKRGANPGPLGGRSETIQKLLCSFFGGAVWWGDTSSQSAAMTWQDAYLAIINVQARDTM